MRFSNRARRETAWWAYRGKMTSASWPGTRDAFIAGAVWSRKESIRDAAQVADAIDLWVGDRIRELAEYDE